MRVDTLFLAVLPAIALAAPQHTQTKRQEADAAPPHGQVQIKNVQTSGEGCPTKSGTTSVQISEDGSTVTIGFSGFKAAIDTQPPPLSKPVAPEVQNCQVHTILWYPQGYQYSVMTATYNGYAQLDPGVTGHLTSTYFFSSNPQNIVRCP